MSYTPTAWKTGDVVTSAKLNKLEQGVADAGGGGDMFRVNFTMTYNDETPSVTCNKTYDEITAEFSENGLSRTVAFFDGMFANGIFQDRHGNPHYFSFCTVTPQESSPASVDVVAISIGNDDACTFTEYSYQLPTGS